MMSPNMLLRARNSPVPEVVSSLVRSPLRYASRLCPRLSPALSQPCSVEVRLLQANGMPWVPSQVTRVRLLGPCAVIPVAPVAGQLPPVNTQDASQSASELIVTAPVVVFTTRFWESNSPHQLLGW